MNSAEKDTTLLSNDAFLAYNRIGGKIRERCLEILREQLAAGQIATKEDINECYWKACQEVLNRGK